jgi:hypothetical protein
MGCGLKNRRCGLDLRVGSVVVGAGGCEEGGYEGMICERDGVVEMIGL